MGSLTIFAFMLFSLFLIVDGFSTKCCISRIPKSLSIGTDLFAEKDDPNEKLKSLGYTEKEVQRSQKQFDLENVKVNVNLVNDVDPVTLTAVGFALIAFNFLVFANLGDAGIAGGLATLLNTINQ